MEEAFPFGVYEKGIDMRVSSFITIGGLLLVPGTLCGHELNFDGKTVTEIREWCIGDLTGFSDVAPEMVVDADDVTELLPYFGEECLDDCVVPFCPPECNFDLNHNHVIGEGDLRVLLGNWGPCRDRADVNDDGEVDLDDVAAVLDDLGTDCRPDLDFSGEVEGNDLNLAQLAWGPGDDHQGDVDGDGYLEIGDDLLAVVNALGRDCYNDVIFDGTVDCDDVIRVCDAGLNCCAVAAEACPDLDC